MALSHLRPALIAAAAFAAGPAIAADEGIPPEFRTSLFELYLGTFVSANTLSADLKNQTASESYSLDGGSFGLGIRGGVDYLAGDWVFGIVGDGSFGGRIAEGDTPNTDLNMPVLGTFRARAGHKWGDTLVYATGGYALAEFNFKLDDKEQDLELSESGWGHGWTLGLGSDFAFTDRLSVGLEYLYVNLDEVDYSTEFRQEFGGIHTLRVGLDYRFRI